MATAARAGAGFKPGQGWFDGIGAARSACLLAATALSMPALAGGAPFAATFSGTGRVCAGGFHVSAKTIDWTSRVSVCKPTPYDVLEEENLSGHRRIAFRLKARSRRCLYEVIEIEMTGGYGWNVTGYRTLESFRNRRTLDPRTMAQQMVLCPMIGPGDHER